MKPEITRSSPPVRMLVYDTLRVEEDSIAYINNREVRGRRAELVIEYWQEDGNEALACGYCGHELIRAKRKSDEYEEDAADSWVLSTCDWCAYWCLSHHRWGDQGLVWYEHEYMLSKARTFDPHLPPAVASEIAQGLRQRPEYYRTINPQKLEKFVGEVFRANYSDCEVTHVGKPQDGGVDLLFVASDGREWMVQVKRREHPKRSESVTTVRNLLGTLLVENKFNGIVVSTADHFSYAANRAVAAVRSRGYTVDLIDRGKLDLMLSPLLPDKAWRVGVREHAPYLEKYFTRKLQQQRAPK